MLSPRRCAAARTRARRAGVCRRTGFLCRSAFRISASSARTADGLTPSDDARRPVKRLCARAFQKDAPLACRNEDDAWVEDAPLLLTKRRALASLLPSIRRFALAEKSLLCAPSHRGIALSLRR